MNAHPPLRREADFCVVGAGPAGLALASQLARRGLTVVCVGDELVWPARYSMWLDEANALGAEAWLASTWTRTIARTRGVVHELGRAYAMLDNARAAAGLIALGGAQLTLVRARATTTTTTTAGAGAGAQTRGRTVLLDDGTEVRCRAVVSAAGSGSRAPRVGRGAAQTAWGAVVDVADAPPDVTAGDAAVLMSFDGVTGARAPSFLYALPLLDGDGDSDGGVRRVFLEETSLAGAPAVDIDELRARLEARVGHALEQVERCFIALESQPIAGSFGAAAGLVHPCTGYSVATSWRMAPLVADAIAAALPGRDDRAAARIEAAIDEVLHSKRRRRTRALHRLGLDLLLSLDAQMTSSFFETVFAAPADAWRTFLDGDADPDVLVVAMSSLFTSLDRPVRAALSRIVLRRHLRLVPALLPALVPLVSPAFARTAP